MLLIGLYGDRRLSDYVSGNREFSKPLKQPAGTSKIRVSQHCCCAEECSAKQQEFEPFDRF
ncbi:MAG: hypothetical protein NXI27_20980 [Alphaproteobacteria bacterium]|nr:hypothetical protein [Alphaproteobacteria bacterium]